MKWTTLRLNMLPITAVEVEYACQTLTNLHNALIDAKAKQSSPLSKSFPIKSIPLFTSAQNFLSITVQKSKIPTNEPYPQKMTYNKLAEEYEKLKESIQSQIKELTKFYIKNSADSFASLFHMLRIRLERVLFDCKRDKNQMKKVLTTTEQENQYEEIAKNFESKKSKDEQLIKPKQNPDTRYLQSWDTFKTQNYAGYQNDSLQLSKNQFFQFDHDQYEKLDFDIKPQTKQYISENNIKSISKSKNSVSPNSKNLKPVSSKSPSSKQNQKRKPATSQLTIATDRDNQKNHIQRNQDKKSFTKIQTEQSSYKNLKVLTSNNASIKNTTKKQIQTKIPKQSNSNTKTDLKETANKKTNEAAGKIKVNGVKNQKKEEIKRNISNMNQNKNLKNHGFFKNQTIQKEQKKEKSLPKPQHQTNHKPSPKKLVVQDFSKKKVEQKKLSPLKSPRKQEINEDKQINDLKKILISSGSELRFTIKMSRQEYKNLLEYKNKMNNKKA